MIADFNSFRVSPLRAFRESPVRARNRAVAFDVALRLRVYYHDDPDPSSLGSDWDTLRDFLNAYDLNTLGQGNISTLDPSPTLWHGTFDPDTEEATITGTCTFFNGRFIGSTPSQPSFPRDGTSCAVVTRVVDFTSGKAATELTMQVGRRAWSAETTWWERTYEISVEDVNGNYNVDTETGFLGLSDGIGIVNEPGTTGTTIITTLNDAHNYFATPYATNIFHNIEPFEAEAVTVTQIWKDDIVGQFEVTRSGSPENISGGFWAIGTPVTAPAFQPGNSFGCRYVGQSGSAIDAVQHTAEFLKIRVPDLSWPDPADWPPSPPFGNGSIPGSKIFHGYVRKATLT